MSAPIFILATSPRSGSTWLQRVLTSTGGVLIWGEQTSHFRGSWPVRRYEMFDSWRWTPDEPAGNDWDLHAFREHGTAIWMATLAPFQVRAREAARAFFESLYTFEHFPRWGTKETYWHEATIGFLRWAWPEATLVYLSRNFADAYTSRYSASYASNMQIDGDKRLFCDRWIEQGRLAAQYGVPDHLGVRVTYETLTTESLEALCGQLGLGSPDWYTGGVCVGASRHEGFTEGDAAIIDDYRERIREVSALLGHECAI